MRLNVFSIARLLLVLCVIRPQNLFGDTVAHTVAVNITNTMGSTLELSTGLLQLNPEQTVRDFQKNAQMFIQNNIPPSSLAPAVQQAIQQMPSAQVWISDGEQPLAPEQTMDVDAPTINVKLGEPTQVQILDPQGNPTQFNAQVAVNFIQYPVKTVGDFKTALKKTIGSMPPQPTISAQYWTPLAVVDNSKITIIEPGGTTVTDDTTPMPFVQWLTAQVKTSDLGGGNLQSNPQLHGSPVSPSLHSTPTTPSLRGSPTTPNLRGGPANPVNPVAPVQPVNPAHPVAPNLSSKVNLQGNPTTPSLRGGPANPANPVAPVQPVNPAHPVGPVPPVPPQPPVNPNLSSKTTNLSGGPTTPNLHGSPATPNLRSNPSLQQKKATLVSATFGVPTQTGLDPARSKDVTSIVNGILQSSNNVFATSYANTGQTMVALFGDPAPGVAKAVELLFQLPNGQYVLLRFGEERYEGSINLNVGAMTGPIKYPIVITDAVYGPNPTQGCGPKTLNVKVLNQVRCMLAQANGTWQIPALSTEELDISDPAYGKLKGLMVKWFYQGDTTTRTISITETLSYSLASDTANQPPANLPAPPPWTNASQPFTIGLAIVNTPTQTDQQSAGATTGYYMALPRTIPGQ